VPPPHLPKPPIHLPVPSFFRGRLFSTPPSPFPPRSHLPCKPHSCSFPLAARMVDFHPSSPYTPITPSRPQPRATISFICELRNVLPDSLSPHYHEEVDQFLCFAAILTRRATTSRCVLRDIGAARTAPSPIFCPHPSFLACFATVGDSPYLLTGAPLCLAVSNLLCPT